MSALLPLISINRLRMETDGDGVTTLIAAKGCPLSCRYCINSDVLGDEVPFRRVSVPELLEQVRIDDLYFQATGGGVVFGGGESLIHADFIREFAEAMPKEWKLTLETSLNVPTENLRKLIPYVDYYIIDIKDMNPEIYRAYTGKDNNQVMKNLQVLIDAGLADRMTIRVPKIPDYNTVEDCKKSVEFLRQMASFRAVDVFPYVIRDYHKRGEKPNHGEGERS